MRLASHRAAGGIVDPGRRTPHAGITPARAAGTPEGDAKARTPPPWLTPGEVVAVGTGGIGMLRTPLLAEEDAA